MTQRPPVPPPPPSPSEKSRGGDSPPTAFWREGTLPATLAARHERALELFYDAESETDDGKAASVLSESLGLQPNAKTALNLSQRLSASGRSLDALAYAGLAYALNPRMDLAATQFAQLLNDHAKPDRAWEIVGETLNRNPSYGPAWTLLESLEAQR